MIIRSTRRGLLPVVALGLLVGCAGDVAPPTSIEGTGSVEGLVFHDANTDGLFDPAAGDEALSDVQVVLRVRGSDQTLAGEATAVTGPDGRFRISGVRAGTHDLFINPETAPEELTFCQNPSPVSVYLDETQFEAVEAQLSCLVTIAEAEALDPAAGEFVTVSGIVTSFPGQIASGYTYIEDETGGIRVFDGGLEGEGIEIGDRIEISGTFAAFNDDLQLTGVTLNQQEEDAAPVVPMEVTTAEIAAAGPTPADPLQGRLVHVSGAAITGAFGTLAAPENAQINDGSGPTEIRIEDGVVADAESLDELYPEGTCYDITGVVGNFRGTAQIFPRSTEDIVEVACN